MVNGPRARALLLFLVSDPRLAELAAAKYNLNTFFENAQNGIVNIIMSWWIRTHPRQIRMPKIITVNTMTTGHRKQAPPRSTI